MFSSASATMRHAKSTSDLGQPGLRNRGQSARFSPDLSPVTARVGFGDRGHALGVRGASPPLLHRPTSPRTEASARAGYQVVVPSRNYTPTSPIQGLRSAQGIPRTASPSGGPGRSTPPSRSRRQTTATEVTVSWAGSLPAPVQLGSPAEVVQRHPGCGVALSWMPTSGAQVPGSVAAARHASANAPAGLVPASRPVAAMAPPSSAQAATGTAVPRTARQSAPQPQSPPSTAAAVLRPWAAGSRALAASPSGQPPVVAQQPPAALGGHARPQACAQGSVSLEVLGSSPSTCSLPATLTSPSDTLMAQNGSSDVGQAELQDVIMDRIATVHRDVRRMQVALMRRSAGARLPLRTSMGYPEAGCGTGEAPSMFTARLRSPPSVEVAATRIQRWWRGRAISKANSRNVSLSPSGVCRSAHADQAAGAGVHDGNRLRGFDSLNGSMRHSVGYGKAVSPECTGRKPFTAVHTAASRIQQSWRVHKWRRRFVEHSAREVGWLGSLEWLQRHSLLYGTELADSEDVKWWTRHRAYAPLDSEVDPWGCTKLREHLHRIWYGNRPSEDAQEPPRDRHREQERSREPGRNQRGLQRQSEASTSQGRLLLQPYAGASASTRSPPRTERAIGPASGQMVQPVMCNRGVSLSPRREAPWARCEAASRGPRPVFGPTPPQSLTSPPQSQRSTRPLAAAAAAIPSPAMLPQTLLNSRGGPVSPLQSQSITVPTAPALQPQPAGSRVSLPLGVTGSLQQHPPAAQHRAPPSGNPSPSLAVYRQVQHKPQAWGRRSDSEPALQQFFLSGAAPVQLPSASEMPGS
uniref:Uncharacterized protein n=1 Tax=Alexandrium monilatum TaxID=311494 RepID=A0A7S4RCB3_9DINO